MAKRKHPAHRISDTDSFYDDLQFISPEADEWTGQPVEMATLLWRQVDRIMKAGTYNVDHIYVSGVMELHQFLYPYHTREYVACYDKLKKDMITELNKINPKQRDAIRPKLEKRLCFVLFGKQIELMTNRGILPVKALV